MSEPVNCIECEEGKLTARYHAGTDWGVCCVLDRIIPVALMVRHDGRIIAPDWCPRKAGS